MPDSLYPRQVDITLSTEQREALRAARAKDRVPAVTRIRAMIELWRRDPNLQRVVTEMGRRDTASSAAPLGHRRYPSRMTVDMTVEMYQLLADAYPVDGVPVGTRIRALVAAWMESAQLQHQAAQQAHSTESTEAS